MEVMKATFDLPPALIRKLKLEAVREGRKLKEVAADVIRRGLDVPASNRRRNVIDTDPQTGLPVIRCRRAANKDELTPERIADILHQQEVEWLNVSR